MRIFIAVLVLIFSLQSWTKADDIGDFEINGVTIGNSLLDFFTSEEIKNNNGYEYPSKKFKLIFLDESKLYNSQYSSNSYYDNLQVSFKPDDENYKIYSVDGMKYYNDNMEACKKKKEEIVNDIKNLFENIKEENYGPFEHSADPEKKTIVFSTNFEFLSGAIISVGCTNWSDKLTKERGWRDSLRVSIVTKEFLYFTTNEAFN